MIKKDLIKTFKIIKKVNRLSYKDLKDITGLSESQISNILNHEGKLVSVDKIEVAMNKMGFHVEPLEFKQIEEDSE